MFFPWRSRLVAVLVLTCGCLWTGGCSSRNTDSPVAKKNREWARQYQDRIKDLENNYQQKLFLPSKLDSLRFLKTVCLGQNFSPDSAHVDSLICLSRSYQTIKLWDNLRQLDLSKYGNWNHLAPHLIYTIRKSLLPNGCLYGDLGPTEAELKVLDDSCALYRLRDNYHSMLGYAYTDSICVDGWVEDFLKAADSLPNLLTWLGTTRDKLDRIRQDGRRNNAIESLLKSYLDASVMEMSGTDQDINISNEYRIMLGWSVDKLAQEAGVPVTWARWAYQKCGIKLDSVK